MLTLYTTFRDFSPARINVIQRNAIHSWLRLEPRPQIFVMGDEPGVKEICKEYDLQQVVVDTNEYGTPMLNDMMTKAEEMASNDNILLVSGDIMLLQDTIQSLQNVDLEMFLGVARKRNNPLINRIIPTDESWEQHATSRMVIDVPTSGDYFLYRKGFLDSMPEMPPFAIGRCRCDSWLIHGAFKAGFLVDMTESATVIHQLHDHNHVRRAGGRSPEIAENRKYAAETFCARIDNCNWKMNKGFKLEENNKFYITTIC